MCAMASQITSLTIVYSTVYSGVDQRKNQSSASLAFVRGIHRWPVNSPHKWPVTRKMFFIWWRHHVSWGTYFIFTEKRKWRKVGRKNDGSLPSRPSPTAWFWRSDGAAPARCLWVSWSSSDVLKGNADVMNCTLCMTQHMSGVRGGKTLAMDVNSLSPDTGGSNCKILVFKIVVQNSSFGPRCGIAAPFTNMV